MTSKDPHNTLLVDAPSIGVCEHCGGAVHLRGRKPKDGKRFCSNKGCQAARARLRRQTFPGDRQAPTECSGCQKPLPPRKWRSTDVLGRWCTKPRCRTARVNTRLEVDGSLDKAKRIEELTLTVEFLRDALMCDDPEFRWLARTVCRKCGLTSAIPDWIHPADDEFDGKWCKGTLRQQEVRMFDLDSARTDAWPTGKVWWDREQVEAHFADDEAVHFVEQKSRTKPSPDSKAAEILAMRAES